VGSKLIICLSGKYLPGKATQKIVNKLLDQGAKAAANIYW